MPFFFNPPPKSAQKRDNRGKREKTGKIGKFCIFFKNSKIYIKIHILTGFWKDTCKFGYFIAFLIFWPFIKEIHEIAKNRSTYPHVISHKSKNILDIDLRFFLKDAQVNSAHSKTKNGPLKTPKNNLP